MYFVSWQQKFGILQLDYYLYFHTFEPLNKLARLL